MIYVLLTYLLGKLFFISYAQFSVLPTTFKKVLGAIFQKILTVCAICNLPTVFLSIKPKHVSYVGRKTQYTSCANFKRTDLLLQFSELHECITKLEFVLFLRSISFIK